MSHKTTMNTNDPDISKESQRKLAFGILKPATQRELAAGVLKQAAQDLRRFHDATSKVERGLYLDAYRWLTVGECASPFSFLNVCQLLNLVPENVREELVGARPVGGFRYWTRCCGRAASRLRISLRQLFVNERNANARLPIGYPEPGEMVFKNAASAGGACLHENVN